MNNKVYTGNLPHEATKVEVEEFFSSCGEINDVKLITDRETGKSRGFGFVTFSTEEGASNAINLDGQSLQGRPLKINIAQEKTFKTRKSY